MKSILTLLNLKYWVLTPKSEVPIREYVTVRPKGHFKSIYKKTGKNTFKWVWENGFIKTDTHSIPLNSSEEVYIVAPEDLPDCLK